MTTETPKFDYTWLAVGAGTVFFGFWLMCITIHFIPDDTLWLTIPTFLTFVAIIGVGIMVFINHYEDWVQYRRVTRNRNRVGY